MTKQYIAPSRQPTGAPKKPKKSVAMYTLSYRLQGMSIGLAAAAIYSYSYLGYYPYQLLIAAAIMGYFIGWLVGRFYYKGQ